MSLKEEKTRKKVLGKNNLMDFVNTDFLYKFNQNLLHIFLYMRYVLFFISIQGNNNQKKFKFNILLILNLN